MSAALSSPDLSVLLDDRYRVEELIARGGMAAVHRGHDERLDRTVALKIMHPHLATDDSFRVRFAREARSAAKLSHPHVVPVYDQGEDQGLLYLSMELIEGRTLRSLLKEHTRLTTRESLQIAEQVLSALSAAHAAGIVHRDIKPENILLTTDGIVKVADFGLARAIGSDNSSTGTLLGTVAYISPEVVTRGHCDERSDLYSLGVVLYEMLTGQQPFRGEQAVHVAFQHVHDDIPAPSLLTSSTPTSVDSLVMWAAARKASSRPADAASLLAAVRELLAELPDAQLDAIPVPAEDTDTQDVPRVTSDLRGARISSDPDRRPDDADAVMALLPEEPTAHSFRTAPESTGPAEDGDPAEADESDPGTTRRELTVRGPRPRHGRHRTGGRRRSPLMRAGAGLAVLALGATAVWDGTDWYLHEGPGGDRTVPVIVGTALPDAESALDSQDLPTRTDEQFSESVPAGHVISASPTAGSVIKRDTPVTLIVSKGVRTFPVPTVTGSSLEDAKATVEDANLRLVEDDPAYSETVPEGEVISQRASADALPADGEVHVVVSQGREPISVPTVTGQSPSQAQKALQDAGFVVTTSRAHSSSVPKGAVSAQDPAGGTAHRGDTIRLTISTGPEMVTVPDVFKKSEKKAVAAMKKAGLKPTVVHDKGDPVFGQVYEQSVAPGSSTEKGSEVTLKVF